MQLGNLYLLFFVSSLQRPWAGPPDPSRAAGGSLLRCCIGVRCRLHAPTWRCRPRSLLTRRRWSCDFAAAITEAKTRRQPPPHHPWPVARSRWGGPQRSASRTASSAGWSPPPRQSTISAARSRRRAASSAASSIRRCNAGPRAWRSAWMCAVRREPLRQESLAAHATLLVEIERTYVPARIQNSPTLYQFETAPSVATPAQHARHCGQGCGQGGRHGVVLRPRHAGRRVSHRRQQRPGRHDLV